MPTLFGAVTAIVHAAPTATAVLAGIDEEPAAAAVIGALPHALQIIRSE